MPALDPEDDRPKKKSAHEIGQDLSLLSVGELAERISLLKGEISRLEAEISRKRASQTAADAFFRKKAEFQETSRGGTCPRRDASYLSPNEVKLQKNSVTFGRILTFG